MIGKHLLVDFYGILPEHLTDGVALARWLLEAARAGRMHALGEPVMHVFAGGGVTGFLLLSESHIALHTYPEFGYLALDIFSCGSADPVAAVDCFRQFLVPAFEEVHVAPRGEAVGL